MDLAQDGSREIGKVTSLLVNDTGEYSFKEIVQSEDV